MNSKRLITALSFLLSILMLVCSFAGCAKPGNDDETTPVVTPVDSSNDTTAADTSNLYDKDGYLKDSIPDDTNLGDKTITTLYWSNCENIEFFSEDISGNPVEDAIHNRNLKVEDRLKVKLGFVGEKGAYGDNATFLTKAQNEINSGTHTYDIYAAYSTTIATLAYNGLCTNLEAYDTLEFDKPWWPETLTKEATINGKIFFTSGDLSTNMLYMMYCCYFNKDILKANNLENPYTLVENNQWTLDKFIEMSQTLTGGENVGFSLGSSVHLDAFFVGSSLMTVERDTDGVPRISPDFGSEKAQALVDKIITFLRTTGNYDETTSKLRSATDFENGHSLFTFSRAAYGFKSLTDVTFGYGIVPIPKYDAEQEEYSTVLGFPFTLYSIADDSNNKDDSALVLEALCSEGYRQITPVLFEQCLKVKYADDPTTAGMFDIIRNSVCFDIGRIYCKNLNRLTFALFRDQVQNMNTGYSTAFASNKTYLENTLAEIISKIDAKQ